MNANGLLIFDSPGRADVLGRVPVNEFQVNVFDSKLIDRKFIIKKR